MRKTDVHALLLVIHYQLSLHTFLVYFPTTLSVGVCGFFSLKIALSPLETGELMKMHIAPVIQIV